MTRSAKSALLASLVSDAFSIETLANDPALCASRRQANPRGGNLRAACSGRTRPPAPLQIFAGQRPDIRARASIHRPLLGKPAVTSDKVARLWDGILNRLAQLKALARDFETIEEVTRSIAAAGAPEWAKMLSSENAAPDDPANVSGMARRLGSCGGGRATSRASMPAQKLMKLATEREAAEKRCRQLFGEIVRERTFYQLDQRLSPAIKAALVEFVRALAQIGKGTGKTAWMHRRTARDAMAKMLQRVPCWIMPTWRVAEQLPAELGAVDLVIIDEASQSDITELARAAARQENPCRGR